MAFDVLAWARERRTVTRWLSNVNVGQATRHLLCPARRIAQQQQFAAFLSSGFGCLLFGGCGIVRVSENKTKHKTEIDDIFDY